MIGPLSFIQLPLLMVKIKYPVSLAILLVTGMHTLYAQSDYSVKSVTGSVSGTSTVSNWKSAVTKMQFKGSVHAVGNTLKSIDDATVNIPVSGIISTKGKSMDKKTAKAFKSDQHPLITYTFRSASVKVNADNGITIEADGNLSMAGMTLPESLTARGKLLPNGEVELSISKKLKMTDFNMKPPTAFLGTVKSGNEITLQFDLVLIPVR